MIVLEPRCRSWAKKCSMLRNAKATMQIARCAYKCPCVQLDGTVAPSGAAETGTDPPLQALLVQHLRTCTETRTPRMPGRPSNSIRIALHHGRSSISVLT